MPRTRRNRRALHADLVAEAKQFMKAFNAFTRTPFVQRIANLPIAQLDRWDHDVVSDVRQCPRPGLGS